MSEQQLIDASIIAGAVGVLALLGLLGTAWRTFKRRMFDREIRRAIARHKGVKG